MECCPSQLLDHEGIRLRVTSSQQFAALRARPYGVRACQSRMNAVAGSGAGALLPQRRFPLLCALVAPLTETMPVPRTRDIDRADHAGDGDSAEQAIGQRKSYRNFLQHGPDFD